MITTSGPSATDSNTKATLTSILTASVTLQTQILSELRVMNLLLLEGFGLSARADLNELRSEFTGDGWIDAQINNLP